MLKQIGFSTLLLMSQFSISGTMYAQDKKTPKIKFINQTQPTLKTSGKGAIIKDYFKANITKPPKHLTLDPFYQKYIDAQGIPITASSDVPDVALIVARDIVLHMLSERPDLRKEMVRNGTRFGIMADTDSTTDLPEQRDWKKPTKDDLRLTDDERGNYDEKIGKLTDQEYWNRRARGMGGLYTTGTEENILGYPDLSNNGKKKGRPRTKYFGENIFIHELAHSVHRAIRGADPKLARKIELAYEDAMKNGLWANSYGTTNVFEYWGEGTQFWFNSNYDYKNGDSYVLSSADLMRYDPQLYKLLMEVYPLDHHIPMDVFYLHEARVRAGK